MPDSSVEDRVLHTEVRMRALFLGAIVLSAMICSAAAQAEPPGPNDMTLNFAVLRNDDQIGTSVVRLHRNGRETIAEISTHVQVKIAFATVYRFDQAETEHWTDGSLVTLNSLTNDNGTTHKVFAKRTGKTLSVETDGKAIEVDPTVNPISLWNAALVQKTTLAFNPQDGSITPMSVVDRGEEQLVLEGRATTAHHYSIRTSFPQDVWYDGRDRLVKVELRASDGSRIHYQRG
jgi:hypothetical protein